MTAYKTTVRADEDLIGIYLRGVQDFGEPAAEKYLEKLRTTIVTLSKFPKMSPLRREFRPPLRAHPCGSQLIIYIEKKEGIVILRVLSGSQDWQHYFD